MKYQELLFSRSSSKDYRWMIIPDYLTDRDLTVIQTTLWSDEIRGKLREVRHLGLWPTFCMQLSEITILMQLTRTLHRDRFGRSIAALQGICVNNSYALYLRFALSWLLINQTQYLDVWYDLNYDEADDLEKRHSKTYLFDMGLLNHSPQELGEENTIEKNSLQNITGLRFDKESLNTIAKSLLPTQTNQLNPIQIAFGCIKSDNYKFRSFDIIVNL